LPFAAPRPQACEARGGPEFEVFACCSRAISSASRKLISASSAGLAATARGKEFAPNSVKLGAERALFKLNGPLQILVDSLETFVKSLHHEACFRKVQIEFRRSCTYILCQSAKP
jgi:hypothetical protein